MNIFIERAIDVKLLASMGWTKVTLRALFQHRFNTACDIGRRAFNGFPECDRCKHFDVSIGMFRLKIDLEFRGQVREIRTGYAQMRASLYITDARPGSPLSSPLPYHFVFSDRYRDGISVHDIFESDSECLPILLPYLSEDEKKRLEELRLAEEEAKHASKQQDQGPKVDNKIARASKELNSFHCFDGLPVELQAAIWELSIEPRPIWLQLKDTKTERKRKWWSLRKRKDEQEIDNLPSDDLPHHKYRCNFIYEWATFPESRYTPAILHVSRSARDIGLCHYEAQNSLEIIRQHPNTHRHLGTLQFNMHSSKAMYVSQTHDLWCSVSPLYRHPTRISSDLEDYMGGFRHEIMTHRSYRSLVSQHIREKSVGNRKLSPNSRRTVVVHMDWNYSGDSQTERRRQFKHMTEELRHSEQLIMESVDPKGIYDYDSIELKYSRFGFCEECLKATEVAGEENMQADRHNWSIPSQLPENFIDI
ncbi:hypothetical protein DSL72_004774 [Monilinia vaccinii-corymbosi]|uniref:2EXR domain-containing protein n=1 Tax=Monilinia vaccinii-corymbosi TaxID=61207 RepID=A0A8A3P041_9HELO|nr:hypothetical protein DSL72_004774 [Monilinia vaccinii-corymbosi]